MLRKIFYSSLIILFLGGCEGEKPKEESANSAEQAKKEKRIPNFGDRPLQFTQIAICQMKCWGVRPDEIKEHIRRTKPKTNEKWIKRRPCPWFVADSLMVASKNTPVSVIFAACDSTTKVLRVISLKDKNACPECKKLKEK
ncbi:MAG: DUF4258 domain-containing protein [Bacteroidia bacterium]|nr:DUF4258 domain-containing protein [Bacteroidia bacterium]MDW8157288.1 DUF4258 domain-containing protein [Bacteroidia bacterium]